MAKQYIVAAFWLWQITICNAQQFLPLHRNYNYIIEALAADTISWHPNIKPIENQLHFSDQNLKKSTSEAFVIPVAAFSLQSFNLTNYSYNSFAGAAVFVPFHQSLQFQASIYGGPAKIYVPNNLTNDSTGIMPFYGKPAFANQTTKYVISFTGRLSYTPRKYISLSIGNDKHFLGDGYRSLLLSDHAAPYPFASITISAWRLKYLSMWAYLKDVNTAEYGSNMDNKYGVFHYLSVNITRRLSFGFFESIIWWKNDPDTDRGIELAYLNPVIFFRPVEYSLHSPDNSLMGGSVRLRLWKKTFIYGQLLIDDFMVKEFLKNSGWWGNKYGIQAGVKTYNLLNFPMLFFQTEVNVIRPYTYTHSQPMLVYGTQFQSLAHPLGANFNELLTVTRYTSGKFIYSARFTIAALGADSTSRNFGSDIYKSSYLKENSYNARIGQGLKTVRSTTSINIAYTVKPLWNLQAFLASGIFYEKKENQPGSNQFFFTIGLRTMLYNTEFDW